MTLVALGHCQAQPVQVFNADAIQVSRNGEAYVVDANFHVPVEPGLAFEVFSDYDHMTDFAPNVRVSKILANDGKVLRVQQASTVHLLFVSIDVESIREVRLDPPHQIESHGISGDFKSLKSLATFTPEDAGTRVHYHAETVPRYMLPGLIGPELIRRQTADQFCAFIREMERRQGRAGRSQCQI